MWRPRSGPGGSWGTLDGLAITLVRGDTMREHRERHPWVQQFQDRIGIALQAVAAHGEGAPGKRLLQAGHLADRYGYDAFLLGDHPAWAPECWAHLAALAVTTQHVRL